MSLAIHCSHCNSRLGIPENLLGKPIRCPNCSQGFTARLDGDAPDEDVIEDGVEIVEEHDEFELVEDDPPPRRRRRDDDDDDDDEPRRPSRRRALIDDDDDEDDDFDERPRRPRKKRPRRRETSSNLLGLTIGGGVLLLVGVVAVLAIVGGGGGRDPHADPAKVNWVAFAPPDNSFTTSFPGGGPLFCDLVQTLDPENRAGADWQLLQQVGVTIEGWKHEVGPRKYLIGRMTFPPQIARQMKPADMIKEMSKSMHEPDAKFSDEKFEGQIDASISGQPAKRASISKSARGVTERQLFWYFAHHDRIYMIIVQAPGLQPTDSVALEFVQKFKLLTAAPGPGGGRRMPGGR